MNIPPRSLRSLPPGGRASRSGRPFPTDATMRFASLGSGSEGNGLVVEVGDTRVLIDCGFRLRETVARLLRLGLAPDSIAAVLVTHEHQDHIGGVAAFARRYRVPVWLTFGTLEMAGERFARLPKVCGFD